MKIWAVNRQMFQFSLIGHNNWVRSAQFSPDARLAISGGDDKVVKLWDLRSKQTITEYYEACGQINTVKFHPSGNCVAAAGDDLSTRLWDIRTHKLLQHYTVSLVFDFKRLIDIILFTGTYRTSDRYIISPNRQLANLIVG